MHDAMPRDPAGNPSAKDPVMIWTRSAADLPADKPFLDPLPVDVLHVPCLGVEKTPDAITRLESIARSGTKSSASPGAGPGPRIIFTSQNAVRIFREICERMPAMWETFATDAIFYTHGRNTAIALENALGNKTDGSHGTRVYKIETRTSEELAHELVRELTRDPAIKSAPSATPGAFEPPVTWISGEETAFDLASFLQSRGIACTRIVVYSTMAHPTDSDGHRLMDASLDEARAQLAMRVRGCRVAVCFASPTAIRGWLEFAGKESALAPDRLAAAVIGPTTARAALSAGFRSVTTCAWPQIADLAALGAQLAGH
jgi:uroporphyrinogen-III synthase